MFHAITPEQAISEATVAQQENRRDEDDGADDTWLALQEEPDQVQHNEHDMRLHQRRIGRLRDDQQWDQALQAVHRGSLWSISSVSVYFSEWVIGSSASQSWSSGAEAVNMRIRLVWRSDRIQMKEYWVWRS